VGVLAAAATVVAARARRNVCGGAPLARGTRSD